MVAETFFLLASFTVPERLGLNPLTLLLLLPLIASISIVYKTLKVPRMQTGVFIKETVTLFFSIAVFIVITALVLFLLAWWATG